MKNIKRIFVSLLLIGGVYFSCIDVDAATSLDCSKTLRNGSRSENVRVLQNMLNDVMGCNLDTDGIFGSKTRTCVVSFQKQYSLSRDGVVGPKTCNKLNEVYSNSNYEVDLDDDTSSGLALDTTRTLSRGSNGSDVRTLQIMLNEIENCNLDVDGNFGYKTAWCVKEYQEDYNLGVDGKVGPATRKSLNSNINKIDSSIYVAIAKTSNKKLNVRQKASTSSKDIGDVYTSEVYKVYGTQVVGGTTWYKIQYKEGKYGYISGNYASKNFILLDISSQVIKLYRNGQVVLNVPTVTGRKSAGWDTPLGAYSIGNKLSTWTNGNERIHLSKYDAYVDYWMPFIGGSYGFHDADWRSASQITNKKTYLSNGSHGCVNMLTEDAKYLYENIYKGLAVHIVE